MLMAKAVNHHLNMHDAQVIIIIIIMEGAYSYHNHHNPHDDHLDADHIQVEELQRQIALICEMWHTSRF